MYNRYDIQVKVSGNVIYWKEFFLNRRQILNKVDKLMKIFQTDYPEDCISVTSKFIPADY